jgi:peptidoglycan/LPS O-acetylase OafA/YrhL
MDATSMTTALVLAAVGAIGVVLLDWRRASPGFRPLARRQPHDDLAEKRAHFRGDIQGLRAIAVGLVVADHILGWPHGGFIGVDVFFVISGFLITGLLVRELERTEKISFKGFYVRRARRILPAALTTLAVTVAASQLLVGGFRAQQTLEDAWYATIFTANIHFATMGTDYFDATTPPSPLQHFWSLAVEEQFYVVWPILLLLASLVVARFTRRPRLAIGVVAAVVVAASLTWSVIDTPASPTTAYFSTATRGWELGIGALLAIGARRLEALPRLLLTVSAWAGVLGIVASAWVIEADTLFPGHMAVLPVASAALVIAGGSRPGRWTPGRLILSSPPFRYVGNISYSLYLWHWPLFVIAGALITVDSVGTKALLVGASLLLASASYHFVEQPVIRSGWLLPEEQKRRLQEEHSGRGVDLPRSAWAMLLCCVLAAGLLMNAVMQAPSRASSVPGVASSAGTAAGTTADTDPLQSEIRTALTAQSWPDLNPSIDEVISGSDTPKDVNDCALAARLDAAECAWGAPTAPRTAVLIGDSTAVAYTPALQEFVSSSGGQWKLISAAMYGCNFVDITIPHSESIDEKCPGRKRDAVSLINQTRPDLVIITHAYIAPEDSAGKEVPPTQWASHLSGYIDEFKSSAGKVVLLAPPPQGKDLKVCYTRLSSPSDCVTKVNKQWLGMAAAEQRLAESLTGVFVDSRPWFCAPNGDCPSFVGTTAQKFDGIHVTAEYARKIGPSMAKALQPVVS